MEEWADGGGGLGSERGERDARRVAAGGRRYGAVWRCRTALRKLKMTAMGGSIVFWTWVAMAAGGRRVGPLGGGRACPRRGFWGAAETGRERDGRARPAASSPAPLPAIHSSPAAAPHADPGLLIRACYQQACAVPAAARRAFCRPLGAVESCFCVGGHVAAGGKMAAGRALAAAAAAAAAAVVAHAALVDVAVRADWPSSPASLLLEAR
jgi:hypothetical protein